MYSPVIGLEIHVQAKTESKMFCRCEADYFSKDPNINVCPVCFGLPGALPVPNKLAVEKCIKLALALNCSINQETKFDRKNYFYPDIPKGYQISQYDQPIGYEGYVEIEVDGDSRRIRIQRVHMEEDTAKSLHTPSPSQEGNSHSDDTLVDYNKSGIPLIEIVTYPDFQTVEEVNLFAKRLRQIVRYLDVSDAEMQKGQMRYELNISVKPDSMPAGKLPDYKVEVKNIGSISVLEKVINFEIKRQSELLEKGEKIPNQTRGLKGMTGETLLQRAKETSDDYRYFPEPDIPPIHITSDQLSVLSSQLPELPHQRKQRYMELGLEGEQADVFVEDTERGDWFDETVQEAMKLESLEADGQPKKLLSFSASQLPTKEIAKWILGDISGQLEKKNLTIKDSPISQKDLLVLLGHLKEKELSGTNAKKVIEHIFDKGGSVTKVIKELNLLQVNDDSVVEAFAKQAIDANPKLVTDLAKNPNAIKALVGQVMKLSQGKVNPKVAEEELRKILKM